MGVKVGRKREGEMEKEVGKRRRKGYKCFYEKNLNMARLKKQKEKLFEN